MKKPDVLGDRDQIISLLNMILSITKESLSYAIQNDIDNLVKSIKLREGFVTKLNEVCQSTKLDEEMYSFFLSIDTESKILFEKMKLSEKRLSRNLVSLYNGKQVVKYF